MKWLIARFLDFFFFFSNQVLNCTVSHITRTTWQAENKQVVEIDRNSHLELVETKNREKKRELH